jgi:hypothetical protein
MDNDSLVILFFRYLLNRRFEGGVRFRQGHAEPT